MKIFYCFLTLLLPVHCFATNNLPIYIEDSHAGTFYWIFKKINPTEEYTLILFDQHSDVTGVLDSDYYRRIIHSFKTEKNTDYLIQKWRQNGQIQNYNWIEPLMPKPISEVIWVPQKKISRKEKYSKLRNAREQMNCYQNLFPRQEEDFSNVIRIFDFDRLIKTSNFKRPVIVTIDLDYFVNYEDRNHFYEIFDYIVKIRNLKAITIAISFSYLRSKAQSDLLLYYLFGYLSNIVNCKVEFEPFADCGKDISLKALDYYKGGRSVPKFEINEVADNIKSLLMNLGKKITTEYKNEKWLALVKKWRTEIASNPKIFLRGNQSNSSADYIFIREDAKFSLELISEGDARNITWKMLVFNSKNYNVYGERAPFARDAPGIICLKEVELHKLNGKRTCGMDDLIAYFDKATKWGVIRIFAEVDYHNRVYRTNVLTVSRYRDDSYVGKLSQIFNLPYVYGSSSICNERGVGPHALCGADCSNFLIYGFRELGYDIDYMGPRQLKGNCSTIYTATNIKDGIFYAGNDRIVIDNNMVAAGLLLHYGSHVVALYEDKIPKNILDLNDLIIHQLGGYPEIISLRTLNRVNNQFYVMTIGN